MLVLIKVVAFMFGYHVHETKRKYLPNQVTLTKRGYYDS